MKKPNLNLKTRIKGAATYTKSEVERHIQDYRKKRKEKAEERRQLKLAEREAYLKAKEDERSLRREEMMEEARERGRLRALQSYDKPSTRYYNYPARYRVHNSMEILDSVSKRLPTHEVFIGSPAPRSKSPVPRSKQPKVPYRNNLYEFVSPPSNYSKNIFNTVDEVLSIKNPRRNRK